ncbi:hypothetical protein CH338_15865 [Rhodoplanes elegans]|uniref:Uncharacterized protein n=1 Tax=Rhodoplanes elegans TaxID=29408 RepID=A0A327KH98_9BRAD|nr:hypothetical protein CH338_15865 [Rhodoplanes elegans]
MGGRHGDRGTGPARRADGPEQPGVRVALVGRLTRPRSAPRPHARDAVLLADARFILEPDLDRLAVGDVGEMGAQRRCEVFLNAAIVPASCAG